MPLIASPVPERAARSVAELASEHLSLQAAIVSTVGVNG